MGKEQIIASCLPRGTGGSDIPGRWGRGRLWRVVSGEVLAGTDIPGRWGRGRLWRVVSGEVLAGTDIPGRWGRCRLWRVVSGEVLAGSDIPGRWGRGRLWRVVFREVLAGKVQTTLRASLFGTFLQTLPDLVTPLKGHSLSPRSCPPTRSAPSESFGY